MKLYFKGNRALLKNRKPAIAIVGSRCMTPYGRKILKQIIPGLVRAGLTIVSGGAFGVDVEAQKLALEYDGKVITVLGSGLNKPAPKTNMQFFKKVEKKGLLVSQFEADVHATKYTFPQRNELISGLSDMVLIIEARKKSGALITADFAIDQGKPVGCFPGRVTDELSYGTNKLLQQGAHLITCTRDILEIMGIANNKPKKQNAVQQTLSEIYN